MKQPVHVRNIQIGDGVPKICIPIVENTSDSILTAAKNVLMACPDIIEWRCDHFDQAEAPEALRRFFSPLPLRSVRHMPPRPRQCASDFSTSSRKPRT